jgi:hypothetical protein
MTTTNALTWRDDNQSLTVSLGDLEIATYTYSATDEQRESPRPFFHPLRTTAGDTVSVYRPWDQSPTTASWPGAGVTVQWWSV